MSTSINTRTFAQNLINTAPNIGGFKFASIPLDLLEVHPTIQRPAKGHEHTIAQQWDDRKCAPLIVSYHDTEGKFFILDGQHRYLAAKLLNRDALPCRVLCGLSLTDEARIFAAQSDNTKRVSAKDAFRALLVASDPAAVALEAMFIRHGFYALDEHQTEQRNRKVYNVGKAKSLPADALEYFFTTIETVEWSDEPRVACGDMMQSFASMYRRLHPNANQQSNLESCLRLTSLRDFQAMAVVRHPRGTVASGYMRLLIEIANGTVTHADFDNLRVDEAA